MPYIPAYRRKAVLTDGPANVGELNFAITSIVNSYVRDRGLSYTSVNDVVGALECAKLELYRRLAAPYEDRKVADNGDVYDALMLPPTERRLSRAEHERSMAALNGPQDVP